MEDSASHLQALGVVAAGLAEHASPLQEIQESSDKMRRYLEAILEVHRIKGELLSLIAVQTETLQSVSETILMEVLPIGTSMISDYYEDIQVMHLREKVTDLASGAVNVDGMVRRLQTGNDEGKEKYLDIGEKAIRLYCLSERKVSIYNRLSREQNLMGMGQLSSGLSRDQDLSGNLVDREGGTVLHYLDPRLVAEYGGLLSRRLHKATLPVSSQTPPSWTNDGSLCVVCQGTFGREGAFVLGTCGHMYHTPCLAKYSQKIKTCHCSVPLPLEYFFSIGEEVKEVPSVMQSFGRES